jgi:hypothetical protein
MPAGSQCAQAGMSKKGARTAVRQMRKLGDRPLLGSALAAGGVTGSLAFTIADWTRKAARADARRDRPDPPRRRVRRGVPG